MPVMMCAMVVISRERVMFWEFLAGFGTLTLSIFIYSKLTTPRINYHGKHVIVTGGSSGIGLDVAKEYLRRGAHVTIVARNPLKLQESLKELSKLTSQPQQQVRMIAVDVGSSEKAVFDAFKPIIEEVGPVEVLINCAGTSIAGEFDSIDSAEFSRMININVLGSIFPSRAVVAEMKARKSGRIVFVSSQIAQIALYGYTSYAASKWALRGLAEALQMELRPYNIFVSLAYPPDTDTPGYEVEMQSKPEITKKLSEAGTLFSSAEVASNIVEYSDRGYYGISTGFDGWLLKNLHPGMSPVNNLWEVWSGIFLTPIFRLISVGYLLYFDSVVKQSMASTGEKEKTKDKKS